MDSYGAKDECGIRPDEVRAGGGSEGADGAKAYRQDHDSRPDGALRHPAAEFLLPFSNVYDLLRWMFQEEAVALLQQYEGTLLWQEGLLQLFRYIEQNREVRLCALKSVGREHLKRFFEADIHAIIHRAVEQIGARASKKRTWIS